MSISAFSVVATPDPITTQTIANETVALADTEQSYAFPTATKRFRLYNRGPDVIKWTFVATESGTNYVSLYPHTHYGWIDLDTSTSYTLYFQSPSANTIIEIDTWA